MTSKIPYEIKMELADDIFMKQCCLAKYGFCEGRIEWHHNFIYAGRRQNKKWCILPVCSYHHRKESKYKKELNCIMLSRATESDLLEYPRTNFKLLCTK